MLAAALVAAVGAIYWQTTSFEFVNLDDGLYLVENPHVNTGVSTENVRWAFTTGHAANWHPLTWISHQVDVSLFGMAPGAHHAVSMAWHALNALLLFALMRALTGSTWKSFFVAAFFAVHPTRVESVAWVAERKDVLSTFFWLASTYAWVAWVRERGAKWYAGALVLFACGLMSKPMLVTVPFTWLLLEHWPLARPVPLRQRVIEKWPFFALAAASSVVTFIVQREGGAVGSATLLPVGDRIAHALVSCMRYLGQLAWPEGLAPFYPHPMHTAAAAAIGSAVVLAAITWLAWRTRRTHGFLLTGWLWFVGTLVPVIGLVQVGTQSHADRYTYVPFIGLFIALAWTMQAASRKWDIPCRVFDVAGAMVAIAAGVVAWQQTAHWRTSEALWIHTVSVTERNARAHNLLGAIYANYGRIELAETVLFRVPVGARSGSGRVGNRWWTVLPVVRALTTQPHPLRRFGTRAGRTLAGTPPSGSIPRGRATLAEAPCSRSLPPTPPGPCYPPGDSHEADSPSLAESCGAARADARRIRPPLPPGASACGAGAHRADRWRAADRDHGHRRHQGRSDR